MTVYIDNTKTVSVMSGDNAPAAFCCSGDTVVFKTKDCFGNKLTDCTVFGSDIPAAEHNQATGPLYIKGAEPGDVLRVDIQKTELGCIGAQSMAPGDGPLGDLVREKSSRLFEVKEGKVIFGNGIEIPVSPMVGVIGTAPKTRAVANMTPGEHGSNMDNTKIKAGTSLYLPVNVQGALLAIGDVHAVMADGEISTCGIEIPGEVTVKVTVEKSLKLPTPFLVTPTEYIAIASAPTLDEASEMVCRKMHDFVKQCTGADSTEIIMLLSLVGNLEICQVVNPLKTVRMAVEKKYIPPAESLFVDRSEQVV